VAWIFTGSWTDSSVSGIPSKYTASTGATAVLKPNQSGLNSITLGMVKGSGAGIAKIELSLDNGTTWVNPSTIQGLSRSDGMLGTSLDSIDLYTSTSTINTNFTYNLPYGNTNIWAIRVTQTGTKNASAVDKNVFVASSSATLGAGNTFTLKPSESLGLGVNVTQINVFSPSSTNGRVIAI
jgi:hypothetical protein